MIPLKTALRVSKHLKNFSLYELVKRHKSVRVRFAPSPTGLLHLGGLKTALYNHIFAKSQNGVTILRIEDTDQTRKVEFATEQLIEDLEWCGITFDEGPYFQSERIELYQKYAKQLLEQNDAYYCFCSKERLNLLRKESLKSGEVPKYDNKCRNLTKEEIDKNLAGGLVPCIRYKFSDTVCDFNDIVCGPHSVINAEGDPVILKVDGYPTYHFANVIDDHFMNISHVLRGVEWLISTPKHLSLFKAFKWDPPLYGHLPLFLNKDGTKLSKRQGDVHIKALREKIMLPTAVVNYIIRFGGGFNFNDSERSMTMFSLEELYKKFDISKVRKNSSKISLDDMKEYNRMEISRMLQSEEGTNELVKAVQKIVKGYYKNRVNSADLNLTEDHVKLILEFMKSRIFSIDDLLSDDFSFIWIWKSDWIRKYDAKDFETVEKLLSEIQSLEWSNTVFRDFFRKFCQQNNLDFSHFMKILRVLFTGMEQGVGVGDIFTILGKKEVQLRLTNALKKRDQQAVTKASNC